MGMEKNTFQDIDPAFNSPKNYPIKSMNIGFMFTLLGSLYLQDFPVNLTSFWL